MLRQGAIVDSMPSSSSQTGNLSVLEVEALRYLDKWTKWARKLLDRKFLQSRWGFLGHYLRHIKALRETRLNAC